jgi:hypothetical protein
LELLAEGFFWAATIVLIALSGYLIVAACLEVAGALGAADPMPAILHAMGLVIVSFAVIELSKFILQEELGRHRELRSARESRRSLTKFITIIVIALSLEVLVMVFEAARRDIADVQYAALLFATVVFALIGLGAYQWLSNAVEPQTGPDAVAPQKRGEDERKKR